MRGKMKNKDNDDYKVIFGGATITKKEANRVGIAFFFGIVGIVTVGLTLGLQNKPGVFIVSLILAAIGYFGVAKRIYK